MQTAGREQAPSGIPPAQVQATPEERHRLSYISIIGVCSWALNLLIFGLLLNYRLILLIDGVVVVLTLALRSWVLAGSSAGLAVHSSLP